MSAAAGPAPPLLEHWQGHAFGSPASTTAAAAAAAGATSSPMLSSSSIHAVASAAYGCSVVPSLLPSSSLTAPRCGSLQRCSNSSYSHSLVRLASEGHLPMHGKPLLSVQTNGHSCWSAPNGLQSPYPTTRYLPGAAALPHAVHAAAAAPPPQQQRTASQTTRAASGAAVLAAAPAGPHDLGPSCTEDSPCRQAAPPGAYPHQHHYDPTRTPHQSCAAFSSSSCSTAASTSTCTPTSYHNAAAQHMQPHWGPVVGWAEQLAGMQGSQGRKEAEAAHPGVGVGSSQAPGHQRGVSCNGSPGCSAGGGGGGEGQGPIRTAAAIGVACNGGGSNGLDGGNGMVATTAIAAAARSSMSCSSSFNNLAADGTWREQDDGEGEAATGVRGQRVQHQDRHHANQHKRQPHVVRPSQITSQLRTRAATRIQAAWRAYRVRRLYLRLQRRLGGAGAELREDSYCGVREFPPIPDEPAISLFTLYGRPSLMRGLQRRVWFDMSRHPDPRMRHPQPQPPPTPPHAAARQPCPAAAALPQPQAPPRTTRTTGVVAGACSSTSSPAAAAATHATASPGAPARTRPPSASGSPALTPSTNTAKDQALQQQAQQQQRLGQQPPLASPFTAASQSRPQPSCTLPSDHSLPHHPPTPQPHSHVPAPVPAPATAASAAPPALPRPAFRGPLRIRVPATQADVPMSEVERILAGGFWKDEPPPDADAGAGAGGGSEPLSLYMRAKMRQEEREAEEALQMLAYEPHDLRHVLGSLKERTLEKLGSLGRTLGALRGPTHGSGPQAGLGYGLGADCAEPYALWATHASASGSDGHAGVAGGPGPGAGGSGWGQQAAGWSGGGALAAAGCGPAGSGQGGGGHVAVGSVLARSLTRAAASAADWWQQLAHRAAAAAGSLPTTHHDAHRRGSAASRRLCRLSSTGSGGWPALRGPGSSSDYAAAAGALSWGGIAAMDSGELHVPLLTVVDETGAAITEPQGAVPIAINWQRYRSRSHVSRMSL